MYLFTKLVLGTLLSVGIVVGAELGRDLFKPGTEVVLDITNKNIQAGPEPRSVIPKNIIEIDSIIVNGQVRCERGLGLFQSGDQCFKYECPAGSVDNGGSCTSNEDKCLGPKYSCRNGDLNMETLFCESEGFCAPGYEEMPYGYCGKEVLRDSDKSQDSSIKDTYRTVTVLTGRVCIGTILNGQCYSSSTVAATEKTNLSCVDKSVPCLPGASSCCHIDLTCSGDTATIKYYDCCPNYKRTDINDVNNFLSGAYYQVGVFGGSPGGKIICNSNGACSIYFQNGECGGDAFGGTFLANSFTLNASTVYECNDEDYYNGSELGADPLKCYTPIDLQCPIGFNDTGATGESACEQFAYCADEENEHLTQVNGSWMCASYDKAAMGCENSSEVYDSRLKMCVEQADVQCAN